MPDRRPWEIGLIRRDETGDTERVFQISGIDLSNADPKALRIGGFHSRYDFHNDFEDTMHEFEVAVEVADLTHDAIIVGAVPSFDMETLAAMLRRNRFCPTWHHRLVCVEALTAGHLGRLVGGLADCAHALGIDMAPYPAHTALGDAQLARAIYDRIIKGEQ